MYKNYLWATSRSAYVRRGRSTECLFCRIVKNDPKIPKKVLYQNRDLMVIMNIYPYNVGHLEIVTKRHVVGLEELSDGELKSLFFMIRNAVKLLKKTLNPEGFNIGINIGGDVSGGSVEHLHVHIVPRYKRDLGFMEVSADTKVMPESLEKTYKNLIKYVNILKL